MVSRPGGGHCIGGDSFGDINPIGKLPATFEKRWEDNATYNSYYAVDKKINFKEGVFVGYRHFDAKNIEPQFPFGFGLTYTTFAYKNLTITPQSAGSRDGARVSLDITNTGTRKGAEVVQLYVGDLRPTVSRPPKELKGFEKVFLEPGETKTASFDLSESAFAYYDVQNKRWTAAPGVYEILAGSSSRDIKAKGEFTLTK